MWCSGCPYAPIDVILHVRKPDFQSTGKSQDITNRTRGHRGPEQDVQSNRTRLLIQARMLAMSSSPFTARWFVIAESLH